MSFAAKLLPENLARQLEAPMHLRLVYRKQRRSGASRLKLSGAAFGQVPVSVTGKHLVLRRKPHEVFQQAARFVAGERRSLQLLRNQDARKISRPMPNQFVRVLTHRAAQRGDERQHLRSGNRFATQLSEALQHCLVPPEPGQHFESRSEAVGCLVR